MNTIIKALEIIQELCPHEINIRAPHRSKSTYIKAWFTEMLGTDGVIEVRISDHDHPNKEYSGICINEINPDFTNLEKEVRKYV